MHREAAGLMPTVSDTFLNELEEIDADLVTVRKRLTALHDLAVYEELRIEAATRIERKANTIDLIRSHLAEVPELALSQGASR
jgi:hypothetical protein